MVKNEPHFVETERWTNLLHNVPGDLSIMLACGACGMRRPILRDMLEAGAGGERRIEKIEARLRCTSCGERQGRILLGYYETAAVEVRG
ncbi:MAG: hypothetical protein DI604_28145 [Delftia acidovorans]|nr:MAG: hypothetical protein DI604_28145 [Delftia acidovorans]